MNQEGTLIILNISDGDYASREGVEYYCIASDNIGFDIAIRSRTITVFYACKQEYIKERGRVSNCVYSTCNSCSYGS